MIRRAPVGPGGSVSQPTNARRVVATARDARIEEESVRDLADFFRSTGPGKEGRIVPYGSPSRPTTVSRPAQAANAGPQAPLSSPGVSPKKAGKLPAGNHTPIISTKTEPTGSGGSRSRLQAREAAVPYGERSSDLIDFIRQGPPKDRTEGIQRNPGTVAPSTGTSNADKIQSIERAGGTRGVTQGSMGSTQDSSMAKSLRSSSNSRTGLLDTTNRPGAVAHNNTSGNPTHSEADEPPRPQRKQRRVRDPYAIDTDSDEDLDNAATSKPKRNDESLMDFLRNAPAPDSAPAGQSAFEDIQQPGNKPIPRKMSAPNIRTRFSRSGSSAGRTPAGRNYSAATSTTQTSKRTDSSNVNGATYVTNVDRERNPPARVVPRFPAVQQARSGRNDSGRSSDLADFLRNSEPPPTTQTYAPPLAKEEGGFTRMFSRRKKSAAGMVH